MKDINMRHLWSGFTVLFSFNFINVSKAPKQVIRTVFVVYDQMKIFLSLFDKRSFITKIFTSLQIEKGDLNISDLLFFIIVFILDYLNYLVLRQPNFYYFED